MLEIAKTIHASRVLITHIEEPDGLSFDDLEIVERQLHGECLTKTFAYNTMLIAI
jgi:hypothetical protein